MRWTKQKKNGNRKIHSKMKNSSKREKTENDKRNKKENIEWMNVFNEWYSYLALSHVATRHKIRQNVCLHGTSFSMWFQVRFGVNTFFPFHFFLAFVHSFAICLPWITKTKLSSNSYGIDVSSVFFSTSFIPIGLKTHNEKTEWVLSRTHTHLPTTLNRLY